MLGSTLAVERSRAGGVPARQEWRHIFGRTASPLVLGVVELTYGLTTSFAPERWGLLAGEKADLGTPREPSVRMLKRDQMTVVRRSGPGGISSPDRGRADARRGEKRWIASDIIAARCVITR